MVFYYKYVIIQGGKENKVFLMGRILEKILRQLDYR